MQLSILVISYNTKDITIKALSSIYASLQKSSLKYEILVLDNCSQDGSALAISKLKIKPLVLFRSQKNLGFGRGNNYLATKAKGQYLLLLNSDTEVLGQGIEKLLKFYLANQRFAFVGGKLLNLNLTPQPSCGPLYNPIIVLAALFFRGDYWHLTRYSPNKVKAVGWVSGACILGKKSYYQALGGFDEHIFMYMEEIDFFKRAQKMGYQVGFYPKAQFIHHGFASSGSKSQPVVNVYKGLLYYYHKHYAILLQLYLRFLLKTKAILGYTLGVLFKNDYLKKTYYEAYQITCRPLKKN